MCFNVFYWGLKAWLQIGHQSLVFLAMSRSTLPCRFPIDATSPYFYGGQFDMHPLLKGTGKSGRRNLQPCELCGERFVEGIQTWRAGWLRNDEGRDINNGYDHYLCWRCWDKCDDEVSEHIILEKLRGLCRATRSTAPQPALLRTLLHSPAIIGAVIHFCMDFGWRLWRVVRFHYPSCKRTWIDQARIVDLGAHEAEDVATRGRPVESIGEVEAHRRDSLAKKYLGTHMNHYALQRRGYFDRPELRI